MDISQKDRDALRTKQHNLTQPYCIGNIVEHKIQDPAEYKRISREEQGLPVDAQPGLPEIQYTSKYLTAHSDVSETSPVCGNDQSNAETTSARGGSSTDEGATTESSADLESNLWLKMDKVEFEKLEWMSERAELEFEKKLQSTTHFDQEGRAVAPNMVAKDPVHDIGSLIRLLDSTFQPQVTYSLNVLSKIAERATSGFYDSVFNENIHELLIKECLLRVRSRVDSINQTICLAALKCLRSLIWNTQIDEIFLDKMSPLDCAEFDSTIWLNTDEVEFEKDLTDKECVEIDAILALVSRTDILKRLLYLLKTEKEAKSKIAYQDCIMDLLIRMARHSRGVCWMINSYDFPNLLINELLPSNIHGLDRHNQSMALRCLKLLRIIAYAALELKSLAQEDYHNIKLTEAIHRKILGYFYIDCLNLRPGIDDILFRLRIETLRLMKSLLLLDHFPKQIFGVLTMNPASTVENLRVISRLESTQEIKAPSSLDWQHAAALIDLIGHMAQYERHHFNSQLMEVHWNIYVIPIAMRWWGDLIGAQLIPHQDVSIAVTSAIQHFDRNKSVIEGVAATSELLNVKFKQLNVTAISYYEKLMREAARSSCISSILKNNGRLRDPVMLPSYGFLDLNTSRSSEFNINKVIGAKTPFVLLRTFVELLHQKDTVMEEIFERHEKNWLLTRYLAEVTRYYKSPPNFEESVQRNLLAQHEMYILARFYLLLTHYYLRPQEVVEGELKERMESYSNLLLDAVSLLGLLSPYSSNLITPREQIFEQAILNNVIYDRLSRESFMSSHIQKFNLKVDVTSLTESLESDLKISHLETGDLNILRPVYMNCSKMSRYWIFQPLIECYHHQSFESPDVIIALLRLNSTLMECSANFTEFVIKSNIEELVCLIGLVFLDSDLFLNPAISSVLKRNLQFILSQCLATGGLFHDASCKLKTLNLTLADYFNKLIDQYEATSYGDLNFSNFLLLFMTPNSDSFFKKKLFSEKLETCLIQMRMPIDEVWIPADVLDWSSEKDPEIRELIKLAGPYLVGRSCLEKCRARCLSAWARNK